MTTIPVTDPAILQRLNGTDSAKPHANGATPVTDPAILARLNGGGEETPAPAPTSHETASLKHYGQQTTANDVALSIAHALPKGAMALLGGPRAVQDLAEQLYAHFNGPPKFPGSLPTPDEDYARLPSSEEMRGKLESTINRPLYEPQTTAGRYAGAGAEMLAVPGSRLANIATGIGGEGGADLAKTVGGNEHVGRLIGALATALTPFGIKMAFTSPGSKLSEASDVAARDVLDQIGPSTATPTEIAPKVQGAAESVISDTRKAINNLAKPYYDASKNVTVAPADWSMIEKNQAFQIALKQVRADPILNDAIKHLPDNSVGVLDVVKKHLDDLEASASSALTGNQRFKAGKLAEGAAATRDAAVKASPDYETALNVGRIGREHDLLPLERSPTGQLANAEKVEQQAKILFKTNPDPGSETQIGDAVRTIAAREPEAARQLVRYQLEKTFNEATQSIVSGANEKGAAKFAADIAGNPQQAKNLKAALEALPNGQDASAAFLNLIKIFKTQGESMAPGEIASIMEKGGTLGQTLKVLGTPIRNIADNLSYAKNISKLADVMTDPAKIKQMRQIANINPSSATAQALFTSMIATNQGQ